VEEELAYLEEVTSRLRAIHGPDLVGVYAGGSWALGGYEPGRSDLDVAVVVRETLTDELADAIAVALRNEAMPCPARGLELVVYSAETAGSGTTEAAFELNLNTGAGVPFVAERAVRPGERHWFAIDRSVLAGHGNVLDGPPASEVFASLAPEELRRMLTGVLRWYEREAPDSEDAVLNAGRSLRYARDGIWLSKPELRDWAADQPGTNSEILARAIEELETT